LAPALNLVSDSTRATAFADVWRHSRDDFGHKADLCKGALAEAHRHLAAQRFGPMLSQLLARACELLDDMDEILVRLDTDRYPAAFIRVGRCIASWKRFNRSCPANTGGGSTEHSPQKKRTAWRR
jgi:hypothetical protein